MSRIPASVYRPGDVPEFHEVEKCRRLMGGEQWSDDPVFTTSHASIDGYRTVCGRRVGRTEQGWFISQEQTDEVGRISCGRCHDILRGRGYQE